MENTDTESIQSQEEIRKKLLQWKPSWIDTEKKIPNIGNDDKFLSYIDYRSKIFATDIIGGYDKYVFEWCLCLFLFFLFFIY